MTIMFTKRSPKSSYSVCPFPSLSHNNSYISWTNQDLETGLGPASLDHTSLFLSKIHGCELNRKHGRIRSKHYAAVDPVGTFGRVVQDVETGSVCHHPQGERQLPAAPPFLSPFSPLSVYHLCPFNPLSIYLSITFAFWELSLITVSVLTSFVDRRVFY